MFGRNLALSSTQVVSKMAAAGDESAHKFPEGFEVYDDEKCMAAEAPSFEGLKDTWIAGEYFNHGNGKPTILLFWEKFATGDYKVNEQVADWVATLGDKVNAIGVSVDATKADAEKYVSRLGKHLEEQRVTMKMVPNVAWDEDKKLSEEFKKVCRLAVMGPSNMFLISESGRIMWRERFSQTYEFEQGLFKRQTENLLANVKLVKVGKQPEEEAEEEEVELDSDDDGALF